MYTAASSLPEFCSSSSLNTMNNIKLCGCALLPQGFPFIKGLPAWPVHNSCVLFSSIPQHITLYHHRVSLRKCVQLLGLPFRKNPKLRNARKTFPCRSAPTLFHAGFIFPFSLQGTVRIRMFPLINWPYIDWDAHQCLQNQHSLLCRISIPFGPKANHSLSGCTH